MKKIVLLILLLLVNKSPAVAQVPGLYHDSIVARVYIEIPPDSLDMLYDSLLSDHYYQTRFIFSNGFRTDTLNQVGFRLRGNTSRYAKKKSFKISFNEYVAGRKFMGVKKMNLNGEHNDPTLIREKLFYDLWVRAGMPERRTAFVRLYINGLYFGLYTNVEEMDKEWLDRVYPDKSGNLYKCTFPADLVFLGTNEQAYKNLVNSTVTGGRVYDLQTNEAADDYSRLVMLITQIDKPTDSSFAAHLNQILHTDHFLKALALDVATGNWDDYSFNKNNFYLYDNPATGKFDFITYDPDNTFGVDWFGIDWAERDYRTWINTWFSLPLAQKTLKVPSLFDQYRQFVITINNTIIHPDSVFPRIDFLKQLITQAAEEDVFRTLDYGYTIADFHDSYIKKIDDHTPYGLKPFFTRRHQTLTEQLGSAGYGELSASSSSFNIYPNPVSDNVAIHINIRIHEPASARIMDPSGKQWSHHLLEPDGDVSIRTGHLSPGFYILELRFRSGTIIRAPFVKAGNR
jgi:hypothetical protein